MRRAATLRHEFVEYIPDDLEDGRLYVSVRYATAAHRCCCGCGKEVVTPLSPTGWTLTFDGESVSLDPSIGNWGFDCRSHYWIRRDQIRWARSWTPEEVATGRARDMLAKENHSGQGSEGAYGEEPATRSSRTTLWQKLRKWLS